LSKKAVTYIVIGAILVITSLAYYSFATGGLFSELPFLNRLIIKPKAEISHKGQWGSRFIACIACHGDITSDANPWHKLHLSNTVNLITCDTCHTNQNMGKRTVEGRNLIDRTLCLKCHPQKFTTYTADHQKKNWMRLHEKLVNYKEKEKCFSECHKRNELDFCGTCHGTHKNEKNWIQTHGKTAEKTQYGCLKCHEKTATCGKKCHFGIVMPHSIPKYEKFWRSDITDPGWMFVHGDIGLDKGVRTCQQCHKLKVEDSQFCETCHHRKFYKEMPNLPVPWMKGGMVYVNKKGARSCWQCHNMHFCAYCHVTGKKPTKNRY